MRNLYYFVVLVTTIFLPITVVNAASLIDIYHEALQHDTQYKIARHSYLANQEKLPPRQSWIAAQYRICRKSSNNVT